MKEWLIKLDRTNTPKIGISKRKKGKENKIYLINPRKLNIKML